MQARPSILDYLAENARRSPDRTVVHYRDRQLTFRQLEERSARCRGALEHAAQQLPRYKRPQRIHFMDALPRTATGKVQRFKLRQLSAGNRGQSPA